MAQSARPRIRGCHHSGSIPSIGGGGLRAASYAQSLTSLEEGVREYVQTYLEGYVG